MPRRAVNYCCKHVINEETQVWCKLLHQFTAEDTIRYRLCHLEVFLYFSLVTRWVDFYYSLTLFIILYLSFSSTALQKYWIIARDREEVEYTDFLWIPVSITSWVQIQLQFHSHCYASKEHTSSIAVTQKDIHLELSINCGMSAHLERWPSERGTEKTIDS